jgi:hypothetical protein
MDEPDEEQTVATRTEVEIQELLGLFDVPAFARRGQELESALARLSARCQRERSALLEMVRLRLRQWAGAVKGPEGWRETFTAPIGELWQLADSEDPDWAQWPAPPRRQRAIAGDLIASLDRFNRRWSRFLSALGLESVNRLIDHYNRYYLLEKECSLGSARLAARHFTPQPRLTREDLAKRFPKLPVPELIARPRRDEPRKNRAPEITKSSDEA